MKNSVPPAASPAKRRAAPSLSTRLLIAFTAAAFATLSMAMIYINQAVQSGLIRVREDALGDHLTALRLAIGNNHGDLQAAGMLLLHTIGGDKNDKSFGCLTDDSGKILFLTPGFRDFSPPLPDFPEPVPAGEPAVRLTEIRNAGGQPLFLASILLHRPGWDAPMTYYFVADAVPEQHFLTKFRIELGLVLLAGTLVSAGLAWIISRRGLQPLERITAEIEHTTAKALQQPDSATDPPPGATDWPREIASLAGAFAALRGRLSRSFNQLRQFSDDAAHEIRTPLNNMMGLTSLTLQRDRTPEEYRAALFSNMEECGHLRKLADGLLFISRADHHHSALAPAAFDAGDAVAEVVDYHLDLAEDQGIALTVEGGGQLTADRGFFRQALTNLLSNALRHTPGGGRIHVHFQPAAAPGGVAVLTVSDTGEGIAPEHLPHILDRFFRVDTARTHQPGIPPQTGLGLSIVKAIMELHGGSIQADSQPGHGTTLRLLWPQQFEKAPIAG